MMDFSAGAGAAGPSETMPAGQLAWAVLTVRSVKPSKSNGQYIDVELTIDEGQPYARKKLWDMIGDPQHAGNSEGYRQMGMVAITRILEAGRNAGPHNPAGYQIPNYEAMSGLRVAIKIGIEKGEGGFGDKNRVAEYLTPNPASASGHKGYQALVAGQYAPANARPVAAPAAQGGFGGFGAAAPAAQPAQGFGVAPVAQAPTGFGAPQPGFQQPQPQPAAAAGWGAGVPTAAAPSTAMGIAPQPATSHSNPTAGATPAWLSQAGQ